MGASRPERIESNPLHELPGRCESDAATGHDALHPPHRLTSTGAASGRSRRRPAARPAAYAKKLVMRSGRGTKGDPYRFRLRTREDDADDRFRASLTALPDLPPWGGG